jgi:hypothetical protein
LGKGFELGAHFVPICGDGNCFWTSVSTYLSATEATPFGTVDNHAALRTQTVKYIKANPTKEPFNKIKNMDRYVEKKSVGDGSMACWSDWYTMCGMSFSLKRPIKQVTFPQYVNGKARPELGPKVSNMCGWKLPGKPIYIHYNGHNHYNAIVPIRSVEKFMITGATQPKKNVPKEKTPLNDL